MKGGEESGREERTEEGREKDDVPGQSPKAYNMNS